MEWNLSSAQANRLFKGGERELDEKFAEAKAAGAGYVVRWGNTDDPESGEAALKRQGGDGNDRPFLLIGGGLVYEELLEAAGVVFVPRRLIAALVDNQSIVSAYCDPESKMRAAIGGLVIRVDGYGSPLRLNVCDHGRLYVELP